MEYQPEPIDNSSVTLTAEYIKLADVLAANMHEIWAKQLLEEGWEYGSDYSEAKRQLPQLIPYQALSDTEKQRRYRVMVETIKTILALGYRLELGDVSHANALLLQEQDLSLILRSLTTSSELNLTSLLDLRRETVRLHLRTPEIYRALGQSILQLGEPLMAYDVLAEGLKYWPQDLRLQQLLALALLRSGSTLAANALLMKLRQSGQQDEETLGLLARTHKDLWLQATDPAMRQQHLQLAIEHYDQAYRLTESNWTGINVATLLLVAGQIDQARGLAHKVQNRCLDKLKAEADRPNYWTLATLGEAALILGDWSGAEGFYCQAAQVGQGRYGDLSSSRRNATLLVRHLGGEVARIKQWFNIPRVVVFCGHMIDRPGRPIPRFPQELEPAVYQAICDRLHRLDVRMGYASAACGSDLLFLEALLELKGELHIVLPYNQEQFIQDSVDVITGANWRERFDRVMQQATEVITASGQKLQESDVVYEYSNRVLHGLARMRAEQLGTELIPLTVWNGQPGDGRGGTASTVKLWQQWTEHIEIIDLAALLQQTPIQLPSAAAINPTPQTLAAPAKLTVTLEREIRALLFADVVHYSQLVEGQYLPFVTHFLGAIAQLSAQPGYQPLLKNTWGDALYFVFSTVREAGQFALDLCELVQTTDWALKGLPAELNLRIALHAGPVDRNIDPITGQVNYIGTHVNHTARIEPITPPGKVYASQAFAAIASSEGLKTFSCDYVGQMPWAKRYGTFPTYHVRRKDRFNP